MRRLVLLSLEAFSSVPPPVGRFRAALDMASSDDGWSASGRGEPNSPGSTDGHGWSASATPPPPEEESDDESWGDAAEAAVGSGGEQKPDDSGPSVDLFDLLAARAQGRRRGRPSAKSAVAPRVEPHGSRPGGASNERGPSVADPLEASRADRQVGAERTGGMFQVPPGAILRVRDNKMFTEPWPLVPFMSQVVQETPVAHDELQAEYTKVSAAYLETDSARVTSLHAAAERLSVHRLALKKRLQMLASAALHTTVGNIWLLQRFVHMAIPVECRALFVEGMRYDETPMKVKTAGASSSKALLPVADSGELCIPGIRPASSSIAHWTPTLCEKTSTNACASKILQSETSLAMLFQNGEEFLAIFAESVCPLQVVERTTARCLQEALMRQSVVSPVADSFASKVRLATTDQASSNFVCERSYLSSAKHKGWTGIHHPCDVHSVARIFNRVFGLCDADISGMIRHSLSLNVAGHMNIFRKALRAEIHHRGVKIVRGTPPVEATQYRNFMMRLFAARGKNILMKRVLLALLPNGDWRSYRIELYVSGQAPEVDNVTAERIVANGLITALAGTMFELYPRHRWTGSDLATDRCGLLEVVHGLGSATYARYMAMLGERKPQGATEDPVDHQAAPVLQDEVHTEPCLAEDDAGNTESIGGGAQLEETTGPAFNSKCRRVASEWWASSPLVNLVIIRLVMEPLRALLSDLLTIAGEKWDHPFAPRVRTVVQCLRQ